jgi:hypothetical protein
MIFTEQTQLVLGIIIAAAAVASIFFGLVRWLVKHYLSELLPNGGSSMKDQVTRVEAKTDKLEAKIDKLYDILINK